MLCHSFPLGWMVCVCVYVRVSGCMNVFLCVCLCVCGQFIEMSASPEAVWKPGQLASGKDRLAVI